jgi:hypothetical protein
MGVGNPSTSSDPAVLRRGFASTYIIMMETTVGKLEVGNENHSWLDLPLTNHLLRT